MIPFYVVVLMLCLFLSMGSIWAGDLGADMCNEEKTRWSILAVLVSVLWPSALFTALCWFIGHVVVTVIGWWRWETSKKPPEGHPADQPRVVVDLGPHRGGACPMCGKPSQRQPWLN